MPQVLALDRAPCGSTFEQRFSASRMADDYVKVYRVADASSGAAGTDAPVSRRPAGA